jgi:2-oxoglutarate dehydrogenase E1 component
VGGAIHVIINNQIGFTTDPHLSRTSYHCTNVAKMIEAPIIHVNGDDVDAVISACKLAVEYRQRFQRDIVIDLVSFRRHGHTNKEDPKITQPLTYQIIDNHPSTLLLYSQQLIRQGILTQEEIDKESESLLASYKIEYENSKEYVPDPLEWLGSNWLGAAISHPSEKPYNQTGVTMDSLHSVCLPPS